MKSLIILASILCVGCATSPQQKVTWPSACGPEPEFFQRYTFDNHRRDIINDLCYNNSSPGNYRTARSAAFQAFRADMRVYHNIHSKR